MRTERRVKCDLRICRRLLVWCAV